jgi:hypothetical protein
MYILRMYMERRRAAYRPSSAATPQGTPGRES